MSISKKILLPTFAVGSVVFAACSLIFLTHGSKTLEVRLDKQDVVNSTIKDTVSPFTGVLFSLGIGLSVSAVVGWTQSLRKSSELRNRVWNLQQLISDKELQIQEMKMSASGINRSQLGWFLEEGKEIDASESISDENTYPLEAALDSINLEKEKVSQTEERNFVVVNAASGFPNVQNVMGLNKKSSSEKLDASATVSK